MTSFRSRSSAFTASRAAFPKDFGPTPTDAIGMLRRLYRQDGGMTTEDWAILCRMVREHDDPTPRQSTREVFDADAYDQA